MPQRSPTSTTCIYCRKFRPSSREHIFPSCIGGALVGRRVCQECNTRLSTIDAHLADNSMVSMLRVGKTPADAFDVKLGGEHLMVDANGVAGPANIRNGFAPEFQPHILLSIAEHQTQMSVRCSDLDSYERLAVFVERCARTGFESMHVKEVGWLPPGQVALVMHRSNAGYLAVHSGDAGESVAFLRDKHAAVTQAIRGHAATAPAATPIPTPQVEFSTTFKPNEVARAVTKIAFTLLAERTPESVVLDSNFDALRAYVLGNDVRDDIHGGVVSADARFVGWHLGDEPEHRFRDYEHLVILDDRDGAFLAIVTLYDSITFTVRLGHTPPQYRCWRLPQMAVSRGDRQDSRWLEPLERAEVLGIEVPPPMIEIIRRLDFGE